MIFLARRVEQAAVFVLLLIIEGVFWTPATFFAGTHVSVWANDPYSTAFYASLLTFCGAVCLLRPGTVLPALRLAWPLLPLVCLAYFSAAWSQFPEVVFTRTTKVTATAVFGVYLISRGDLGDVVALLIKVNLVGVAASAAIFLVAPQFAYSITVPEYATALRGAFSDKNALGINAGLGVLVGVYAFVKHYGSRWVSGFVVPANLFLLWQSQSKTPVLLLLVALYVVFLATAVRHRSRPGMVAAFVLLVLGLAGGAIVVSSFGDLMVTLGRDPTLSARTRIWQVVMPYIEQRPYLGYGFGTFWIPQSREVNQVWAILSWRAPNAHNIWIQLALDLGLTGCACAALAWLAAFGRAVRVLLSPAAEVVFPLAVLAAIFVEGLTEYAFFSEGLLWVLFAALLVHLGREVQAARTASRAAVPSRQFASPLSPILVQR